ncbi:hypothetical protein HYPGJ_31433 [Hyphomicrobium sp. GJ21]|uniref:hypothetical protein n=1 Tax=Hyphomicrobium sp. GJ21 TaxID=113574 RepID=UPI000622B819|nr:hypothetical protein [Hyphomicrobium sp. GJ21]CEJ87872.1 hypothetical protein HYPGJ_31433 [Hyphomicrobium sp. GJ21]
MATSRDAVRQRFLRVREAPEATRRADFKGYRRKLVIRVDNELMAELQLLKVVSGENKNAFCVRVLKARVVEALKQEKEKHDPSDWQVLIRVAREGRG